MQLSVDKECHALAVVLLDRINISYKLIPRTESNESIEKALTEHEDIIGPQLTVFIDNWNERLTFDKIPHYRNGSLQNVIQTSRANNGERIFSHILQTRETTIAILVEPEHACQANDILQDLIKYAQRALGRSRAQPILRTRGLKLHQAPALAPVRQSQWARGPPKQVSQTRFQPTNSNRESDQVPTQQQPTVKNTSRQHDLALVDKVIEDLNQEQIDASDILTAASESPIQDTSQATEQSPTSEALVTQEIGVATPVPKRIENRVQQLNEDENPAGFDYEVSRQSEFNAAAGALADNPGEKATPASLFNRVIDASNQCPSPARSNASDSTGHKHDTRFAKAHKLPLPSPLFNGNKASEE